MCAFATNGRFLPDGSALVEMVAEIVDTYRHPADAVMEIVHWMDRPFDPNSPQAELCQQLNDFIFSASWPQDERDLTACRAAVRHLGEMIGDRCPRGSMRRA